MLYTGVDLFHRHQPRFKEKGCIDILSIPNLKMHFWKVMNSDQVFDSKEPPIELEEIFSLVWRMAKECRGDSLALLSVLRTLEDLHRGIREELFLESLPDNRQQLYNLLKNIEENGGWPYIQRMKLRAFLDRELFVSTEVDLVTDVAESSDTES